MSQSQVAEILDVHRTTIGKYENNECEPPLYKFIKMIDLYHSDANFILFGDSSNEIRVRNLPDINFQELYYIINAYLESNNLNK